ncbi:MAG TPA: 4Fe-4S dicluster domain-containing protein [Deltaproteobacteria bacterium]|nr:4Fe-4S dicluster domain-containing protein [Deltaproteobacteria bacterium]
MACSIYKITESHTALARRMNRLPMKALMNETFLEILALLYTEEEAAILSKAPLKPATASRIAQCSGRRTEEVAPLLDRLAGQGLLAAGGDGERKYFVLAFLPGLFEYYTVMGDDDEKKQAFAALHERYYNEEYARNANKRRLFLARVIPIEESITPQMGIMPGESVREAVLRHDYWAVAPCACKKQNALIGRACSKPVEVCMQFGNAGRGAVKTGFSRQIDRSEVLDILDAAEEAGLVHVTDNVERPHLMCNCCGCCCDAMATINRFNMPAVFAASRYQASPVSTACKACGLCERSCPTQALTRREGALHFQPERCIGCGVCASHCRHGGIRLVRREGIHHTPENYGQLIITGMQQLSGIDRLAPTLAPRMSRMIGTWIQGGMDKGIERRKAALD